MAVPNLSLLLSKSGVFSGKEKLGQEMANEGVSLIEA